MAARQEELRRALAKMEMHEEKKRSETLNKARPGVCVCACVRVCVCVCVSVCVCLCVCVCCAVSTHA